MRPAVTEDEPRSVVQPRGRTSRPTRGAATFFGLFERLQDPSLSPEERRQVLDALKQEAARQEAGQVVSASRRVVAAVGAFLETIPENGGKSKRARSELLLEVDQRLEEAEVCMTTVVEVMRSQLAVEPCDRRRELLNLALPVRNCLRAAKSVIEKVRRREAPTYQVGENGQSVSP